MARLAFRHAFTIVATARICAGTRDAGVVLLGKTNG